jgi:MPBQ/MSBQ methyltransferase
MSVEARAAGPAKQESAAFRKLREYLAYRQRTNVQSGGPFENLPIENMYDGAAEAAFRVRGYPRYMNHGYWYEDTSSTEQASDNLMSRIVTGVRERCSESVLCFDETAVDVACGLGGTTRYLSRHWNVGKLIGINISERQLEVCRTTVPGCRFMRMDAACLELDSNSVGCVVCVEAAFHFKTRAKFLAEAFRILKPGGVLALTDVIMVPGSHEALPRFKSTLPAENHIPSMDAYRQLMRSVGFAQCDLEDITRVGWRSYFPFFTTYLHREWMENRLSFEWMQHLLDSLYVLDVITDTQLLCFAVKGVDGGAPTQT